MKILVTGTRGVPDIPGGVEKHCQELYPRIASMGHEVLLCRRSSYVSEKLESWNGVKLIDCPAPRSKSLEAIVHTFICLIEALRHGPDVVHIHAVGPALLTPVAKLFGFAVVFTHHGQDYERAKWGGLAKLALRLGEKLGATFADEVIAISSLIKNLLEVDRHRSARLIPNGVAPPPEQVGADYLERIGVRPGSYIFAAARFVPEKGLHDLIQAFTLLDTPLKLLIAGDSDHETEYSRKLRTSALRDARIVMTGYITGNPLLQAYGNARLFVLPSYHEGLPIALLEALSFGLPVLVSDIPANLEMSLPDHRYFKCGDVADLQEKIRLLTGMEMPDEERTEISRSLHEKYNWDNIATEVMEVYQLARDRRTRCKFRKK